MKLSETQFAAIMVMTVAIDKLTEDWVLAQIGAQGVAALLVTFFYFLGVGLSIAAIFFYLPSTWQKNRARNAADPKTRTNPKPPSV